MEKNSRIYVAGHKGLVGSALMRKLQGNGFNNIITRSFSDMDLRDFASVEEFFKSEKPEYVFLAAAKVGGIHANATYPADFIYDNLCIQNNLIHSSYKYGVKRLLFLGSSCVYPKNCPQPMKEEYLLTGELEKTNEPYAIAKIAGIKMCESYNRQYGTKFFAVMPTNLYGPWDNYDLQTSHVLPALIRKIHEAKINGEQAVKLWGSGRPRREFLFSDDMADACVYLMGLSDEKLFADGFPLINIGCGKDLTIRELAETIKEVVGFKGEWEWDSEKPDGTMQKLLNTERLTELGWRPSLNLKEGLELAYKSFLAGEQRQK